MKTRVTELLGIEVPIVQGGLANLAYSELASAVSNAGGLGQITATSLRSADELRTEIRKTKAATNRPFGVNIAISQHKSVEEFVDVVVEEGVAAVSLTAGNPEPILKRLADTSIKKLVLIGSVRQAQKAESLGADAVMAVGQEGGGHIGRADTGTIVLIPRVVDSVNIPVIASGGIADGRGLLAALALGAEGIEMGTRFIATKECIAHEAYKEALVRGREDETVIIKRSLGMPGRVLPSPWVEKILEEEARGTTMERLWPFISGERNRHAIIEGQLDEGFAWAGQSMGLIHNVPTVAELFEEMLSTAREHFARIGQSGL
ncbi:nitronate monooxygenase [Alicyclobacillus cycloheptanicus]|uniref:Probable nitronate monooxygenase n=1 Tax=Alicyclobacillus cycloheptanicus TaxID=1457 RepID=A0ABT9XGC0_9BACL|nr:nitronate monooxygenase family protein [Alicyclobacillus cycloheptanicus]MDQ0189124.1 NAD(P)H-dependent flavin oxidoreductase YrpB (nitropropane dioxygenase family) [Alicyclobacillus cycloheptanicus]WDM00252.1 nitronate monooxygenase [Alicyclobacillus cycloheptanicus]